MKSLTGLSVREYLPLVSTVARSKSTAAANLLMVVSASASLWLLVCTQEKALLNVSMPAFDVCIVRLILLQSGDMVRKVCTHVLMTTSCVDTLVQPPGGTLHKTQWPGNRN